MRPSRLCHVEQVARDSDASRGSQSLEAIRAATLDVQQDHTLVEAINDTHAAVRQCSNVPRPFKLIKPTALAAHRRYQSQLRGCNRSSGKRFFHRYPTERQLRWSSARSKRRSSMQQNDRYVCACVAQGGEQMAHGKASARSGHSGRRIIGRCLDKSWKEEKQRTASTFIICPLAILIAPLSRPYRALIPPLHPPVPFFSNVYRRECRPQSGSHPTPYT